MARKRREADLIGPICQWAGFVVLASLFFPRVCQTLISFGIIALAILGIGAIGLLVFGIYRVATPERNMRSITSNPFVTPVNDEDQADSEQQSELESYHALSSPKQFIEQLRSMDWFQFEKLVGRVYAKLGHAVTRLGGARPDGGIDLIIEKAGQRKAVQCKQWKAWKVGVKAIREFLGALTDAGIKNGIFITLRGYTLEARQLAEKHGIEIVDQDDLAQMLEATDARLDPEIQELLNDTRKFCPQCERELVMRVAAKGSNPGRRFWGCSGYPRCRFTMPTPETNQHRKSVV